MSKKGIVAVDSGKQARKSDNSFPQFSPYVKTVISTLETPQVMSSASWRTFVNQCMNGGPDAELRRVANVHTRRTAGAFFTGEDLAKRLVDAPDGGLVEGHVYYDPSCGVGNLLLEVARRLPVKKTVAATVRLWGRYLLGCDAEKDFVRLAKARLLMLAIERVSPNAYVMESDLDQIFPSLVCLDAMESTELYRRANCLIMNPPFCSVDAPETADWTSGKVNSAAVLVAHALAEVKAGTCIAAILPDVLRCGARYARWRELIEQHCSVIETRTHGIFSSHADVDVFILDARKRTAKVTEDKCAVDWGMAARAPRTLGQAMSVHVGSVVPYRHKKVGPRLPYIHAKGLPWWRYRKSIEETRRFSGTTFTPPFVVVRRTSRPGDRKRAVACIITADSNVAVENHLLVLRPIDGSLAMCKDVLARLKDERTDRWLDERIRCRHLTVGAIQELPWWEIQHA